MPAYRVTPRAYEDLQNIGYYTEQQWGKSQRNVYLKSLEQRFQWLAENPQLGKHRTEIQAGYYSFPHQQHVVFYMQNNRCIDIIGIPHKEMDIVSYFLSDD